jgi:hypothetical protein
MSRASRPGRWLGGAVPVPAPEPASAPRQDERHITYVNGRAYLNERSNRVPNYSITPEDQKVLHQRRLEAAEQRRIESDLNFARALQLGKALRQLKGGG